MSEAPLGTKLTKDLDPRAIDEVWERIDARRRGRPSWGRATAIAGALALVVALVVLFLRQSGNAPAALRVEGGAPLPTAVALTQAVTLDDGSCVGISGGTLVPLANDGKAIRFSLPRGQATFDVVPGGPRTWTVDAGLVTVTVLGTRFDVTRGEHDARVSVERGKVLVTGKGIPGGEVVLTAGEHVEVNDGSAAPAPSATLTPPSDAADAEVSPGPAPRQAPSVAPATPGPTAALPSPLAPPSASSTTSPEDAWHPLADRGKYAEAYATLGKEGVAREARRAERPEDLLQVADVARLSGHPADAVLPLERLLANHPTSKAAPQAAFTLGKIELDALGRPGRAAAAFEKAISLGVPAALKEDAFARRVEAYAKAGDPSKARTARNAYESAFPNGRYTESVQRLAP